jgi:hypothetical protein
MNTLKIKKMSYKTLTTTLKVIKVTILITRSAVLKLSAAVTSWLDDVESLILD